MRLIDADAFDRDLCNHKFTAALNEAADAGTAFEDKEMYYSTQSFRDVMKYRPTIEAVPVIRCTACKHWDQCSGLTARMCYQWRRHTKQFDYCSYGEVRACG